MADRKQQILAEGRSNYLEGFMENLLIQTTTKWITFQMYSYHKEELM